MNQRLNIIAVEVQKDPLSLHPPHPRTRREEIQAHFEREWHLNPNQFNPERHSMERERIERTFLLIRDALYNFPKNKNIYIADLGCGEGILSRRLIGLSEKVEVHALDVARNALKLLGNEQRIRPVHACLPSTLLEDAFYDYVISTEVIGHLPSREHRLYLNELARLAKTKGLIFCSSQLDLDSEDPLGCFASLAETEFEILSWKLSYHRLYIRLKGWIEAPFYFSEASKDRLLREKILQKKKKFSSLWFQLNSTKKAGRFWGMVVFMTRPIAGWLKNNRGLLLTLETLSKILFNERGVTHALFIGRKKPIYHSHPQTLNFD